MKKVFSFLLFGFAALLMACSDEESTSPQPQTKPVKEITLSATSLQLNEGDTHLLNLNLEPADGEYTHLEWSSNNPAVASVDHQGLVTARMGGTATIICCVDDLRATCQVTVSARLPESDPLVGDYYYADGTWSTELNTEKPVIGIVFWTGNPTEQDAALKREHPDCTHGLVVGLNHDRSYWQSKFASSGSRVSDWVEEHLTEYEPPIASDQAQSIGRIMGYNNTKAIEAYNAASENSEWPVEAIVATVEYRRKVAAPPTSSDWYLPSPKELSLLCSGPYEGNIYYPGETLGAANRSLINERMTGLEGINSLAGVIHWSSAEYDERGVSEEAVRVGWMVAINIFFNDGDISVSFKDGNSAYLRYVLAF